MAKMGETSIYDCSKNYCSQTLALFSDPDRAITAIFVLNTSYCIYQVLIGYFSCWISYILLVLEWYNSISCANRTWLVLNSKCLK